MWPIQFCFLIFYYMYGYLAACVHVYLLACQVPVETRRECWFETRVIGNHYPLCGSWDLKPGPQEEESVLLTTESSLSFFRQLLIDCFEFYFMHSSLLLSVPLYPPSALATSEPKEHEHLAMEAAVGHAESHGGFLFPHIFPCSEPLVCCQAACFCHTINTGSYQISSDLLWSAGPSLSHALAVHRWCTF